MPSYQADRGSVKTALEIGIAAVAALAAVLSIPFVASQLSSVSPAPTPVSAPVSPARPGPAGGTASSTASAVGVQAWVGHWQGAVNQPESHNYKTYAIDLRLSLNGQGELTGTSQYTLYECRGQLRLVNMEPRQAHMLEHIIYNPLGTSDGCITDVAMDLILESSGQLQVQIHRNDDFGADLLVIATLARVP